MWSKVLFLWAIFHVKNEDGRAMLKPFYLFVKKQNLCRFYTLQTENTYSPPLHLQSSLTLLNRQSVREDFGRFEECKGGLQESLQIV